MYQEQQQTQRQSLVQRLIAMVIQWIDWLLTVLRQPFHAVETLLVAIIGGWGVVFFGTANLFNLSPLYGPMAQRGTQTDWGVRAVSLVAWWCLSLYLNNATLRVLAQITLISWYSYLMLLFASSGVVSFGAVVHGICFGYSVWVLWRYAGRKQADDA